MSVSGRIRGLCEQKGISINRLEKESGVGRGAIMRWDAHSPSAEKVSAVADYFGVTTEYLLTGEQKQPPQPLAVAVGPNKRALLNSIEDMSEAEAAFALDFIKKIKSIRG